MGFKLGKNRGLEATNGEIKTKLSFGRQPSGIELFLEHLLYLCL